MFSTCNEAAFLLNVFCCTLVYSVQCTSTHLTGLSVTILMPSEMNSLAHMMKRRQLMANTVISQVAQLLGRGSAATVSYGVELEPPSVPLSCIKIYSMHYSLFYTLLSNQVFVYPLPMKNVKMQLFRYTM